MQRFTLKPALLPLLFVLLITSASFGQEEKSKSGLDFSADIMSRYIWRGLNLGGSSPSIQPGIEYTYGNLAIGAWGAYSFNQAITRQESDLYATYTFAEIVSLSLTDYFFPYEDTMPNNYFEYGKDKTGHLFELSAKFLGTEKIPLSLMIATNVYGADARKSNGDLQYSTYVELGYGFKVKETECSAFLGFTPTKPDTDKGETGFYGSKAGIINLGLTASKSIPITDKYSLPLTASLITNPTAKNIFLVFGISF